LFFDISIDIAIGRMKVRDEEGGNRNRMDVETVEFYDNVRTAYLGIAEREPERFRIIDADRSVEEIHTSVVSAVDAFLQLSPAAS
jgi:dTMP kinase